MYIEDEFGHQYSYQDMVQDNLEFGGAIHLQSTLRDDQSPPIYVVGDFNDYDIGQAIQIDYMSSETLLIESGSGTLQLLQDLDQDGLDFDDTILSTPFAYDVAQGDILFYDMDVVTSSEVQIVPTIDSRIEIQLLDELLNYTFKFVYYVGDEQRVYEQTLSPTTD